MSGYYAAAPDRIARQPLDGGIEITEQQYREALAMLTDSDDRRIISTDGSVFALVNPPEPVEPEPEPPTQEEIIASFRWAIQGHIDATAREKNYDSGNSLASYVASTNPTWANEALVFVAWRDSVWEYSYSELDKVMSGVRPKPSVEEFILELPVIVWPE